MQEPERTDIYFRTPASRKLVELIELNADELTQRYLEDIQQHPRLATYRGFDQKEIYNRAFRVYSQLGKWISQETTPDEVKVYWIALGKERREEGFPLSEIVLSLSLLRRRLWQKVQSEGLMDSALDLFQAMELHNRVVLFFDRALYYAVVGFECREDLDR